MQEALDLFKNSKIARASFGDAVVDHYVHYAKTEIHAFNSSVTEWERVRGFERT
jgi:glutamine synthetase